MGAIKIGPRKVSGIRESVIEVCAVKVSVIYISIWKVP